MNSSICDVQKHSFTANEKVFLDANVWLYVFGQSTPNNRKAQQYSGALQKMLVAQCSLYTDVLVMSEVINRYVRIHWKDNFSKVYQDFKVYRRSADFLPAASGAADVVRRILRTAKITPDGFERMNSLDLLRDFESGQYDFNDQVICRLCVCQGFTLLTDDADFAGGPAPVLTANFSLLNSQKP